MLNEQLTGPTPCSRIDQPGFVLAHQIGTYLRQCGIQIKKKMNLFAKQMDSASNNCSWGSGRFDRLTKQAVRAYDAGKDVRHPFMRLPFSGHHPPG